MRARVVVIVGVGLLLTLIGVAVYETQFGDLCFYEGDFHVRWQAFPDPDDPCARCLCMPPYVECRSVRPSFTTPGNSRYRTMQYLKLDALEGELAPPLRPGPFMMTVTGQCYEGRVELTIPPEPIPARSYEWPWRSQVKVHEAGDDLRFGYWTRDELCLAIPRTLTTVNARISYNYEVLMSETVSVGDHCTHGHFCFTDDGCRVPE